MDQVLTVDCDVEDVAAVAGLGLAPVHAGVSVVDTAVDVGGAVATTPAQLTGNGRLTGRVSLQRPAAGVPQVCTAHSDGLELEELRPVGMDAQRGCCGSRQEVTD